MAITLVLPDYSGLRELTHIPLTRLYTCSIVLATIWYSEICPKALYFWGRADYVPGARDLYYLLGI